MSYKNPPPKKNKKTVAKVFVFKNLELVSPIWDFKVLTPLSKLCEKQYGHGQYVRRPDCLGLSVGHYGGPKYGHPMYS